MPLNKTSLEKIFGGEWIVLNDVIQLILDEDNYINYWIKFNDFILNEDSFNPIKETKIVLKWIKIRGKLGNFK